MTVFSHPLSEDNTKSCYLDVRNIRMLEILLERKSDTVFRKLLEAVCCQSKAQLLRCLHCGLQAPGEGAVQGHRAGSSRALSPGLWLPRKGALTGTAHLAWAVSSPFPRSSEQIPAPHSSQGTQDTSQPLLTQTSGGSGTAQPPDKNLQRQSDKTIWNVCLHSQPLSR